LMSRCTSPWVCAWTRLQNGLGDLQGLVRRVRAAAAQALGKRLAVHERHDVEDQTLTSPVKWIARMAGCCSRASAFAPVGSATSIPGVQAISG